MGERHAFSVRCYDVIRNLNLIPRFLYQLSEVLLVTPTARTMLPDPKAALDDSWQGSVFVRQSCVFVCELLKILKYIGELGHCCCRILFIEPAFPPHLLTSDSHTSRPTRASKAMTRLSLTVIPRTHTRLVYNAWKGLGPRL